MNAAVPWWGVDETTGNLVLRYADVAVDLIMRRVEREGRALLLRHREFDLLVYMLWHHGRTIGQVELYERIFGLRFRPETNRIPVHICRLRDAMDRGFGTTLIQTIEGEGYCVARVEGAGQ